MSSPPVLVGNRQCTIDEAIYVALNLSQVQIDTASFSRLSEKKVSTNVDNKHISTASDKQQRDHFSVEETRMLMFVQVNRFLRGHCQVSASIVEVLVALLNNGISPIICDLHGLADALAGLGSCIHCGETKDISSVLLATPLQFPGVSGKELPVFLSDNVVITALALLQVYAAGKLIDLADVASAFSCEAVQVPDSLFEPFSSDVCRPHRGQIQVARNLRTLLANSKNLISRKGKNSTDSGSLGECFRCLPHYHGPIREMFDGAKRVVSIELNSCEIHSDSFFHSQPLDMAMLNLQSSLFVVASYAQQRVHELSISPRLLVDFKAVVQEVSERVETLRVSLQKSSSFIGKGEFSSSFQVINGLTLAVSLLQWLLSIEILMSLQKIEERDAQKLEASQEAIAQAEQRAIEYELKHQQQQKEGKERGNENKGKGNKKHKKRQQKKKKKEKRQPKGIVLGDGCSEFRKFLAKSLKSCVFHNESEFRELLDFCATGFLNPFNIATMQCVAQLLAGHDQDRRIPKIAKGTRDFDPQFMIIRERVFKTIKDAFSRHGAVAIDTPIFELRQTLLGSYGEEGQKLIYNLADQGGEQLSLRYDLTVPFARYIAMHSVGNIKRFHIGTVYRRDNPAMARGRFREFYQCDYDVAGQYDSMVADADVLKVVCEVLDELNVGNYVVKLSHRKLLNALMEACEVPAEKFMSICSAIDKLDKESWETVRTEMIYEKGLDPNSADKIGEFVRMRSSEPEELLAILKNDSRLSTLVQAQEAFEDLDRLFRYLRVMGCIDRILFDLSLARGLAYYDGLIYEAVCISSQGAFVGSIAAGGRYDHLVGKFSSKDIPAVGVSIGIERVLTIIQQQENKTDSTEYRSSLTEVLVASVGPNMLEHRMEICSDLWKGT